jgi:predicted unusual protein kinase regulating ubiquinone biosynthesis (AarF/ABC1/UbiB family)
LLRDFRDALLAELDYAKEAANVKFFAASSPMKRDSQFPK